MRIGEIRKNIILTSSNEFIDEISNYFFNENFIGKEIKAIKDLFATSHSNKEKKDDEDFKYFYDKVAYVDFCKFNNLAPNKLTAKKYLAAAFNPQTREFSYNSNKFYKDGSTPLNTILVLNVKGSDIYKVLTAVYTCLRDNGIDNCITIPSFNRFEEGLTDSVRININVADMEKVVGLIGDLPSIINLIDKPNMLYPRVNDYIGYDAVVSQDGGREARMSDFVCRAIGDALNYTIMNFLDHDGEQLIENGGETIIQFRKSFLDENKSLKECDLRILQRMIAVDPSNKNIFINNLKEALLGRTMTKSVYITREDNEKFDDIYGKLDDDSILFESEKLEFDVKIPSVEVEGEQTLTQVPVVASANDLLVQEEQPDELMVQEEQPDVLMVQEVQPADLMVQEEQPADLMVQEEQPADLMVQEEQPDELMVHEEQPADLMVQEEQPDVLMVQEIQPTDLMVQEEQPDSLLVQEEEKELTPEEQPKEESLYEQFQKREGNEEAYLDSLLASVQGGNQESTETITEPVVEDNSKKEDVHFYEGSANVGENFVVSSTPAVAAPSVENTTQESQPKEESELVRPEDMTDEQKKLVSDTFAELPADDARFLEYLDNVLNKLPEADLNALSGESGEQSLEEDALNKEEIQSLAGNQLDQQMTYERALKYKDLVSNLNVLNTKVKGTDFTLLDYFDQQQLLSKIDPNASYITFTDEIYTGLGIVEECIIKYVSNYGNVPLDKISEEYGIKLLGPTVKKEQPKGLMGLFKKKRS